MNASTHLLLFHMYLISADGDHGSQRDDNALTSILITTIITTAATTGDPTSSMIVINEDVPPPVSYNSLIVNGLYNYFDN